MAEKLLTPEEVAERLVMSPKTIRDWLRKGKLRGVKTGKLWRIRERDLEAFIEGKGSREIPLLRECTCQEGRKFLKADKSGPRIARQGERHLETDPFFHVEKWALETGIPDLAKEHHRYIEGDS